jgi:O-antigen/teichoic acid export membrane protein
VSLGRQLLRNIVSSWMSYAVRLTVGFFFVPYIATKLGGERYGVWTIIWQTVNYFTLLDFGLERAVVRYVSKFAGDRNWRAISKTLSTATALYSGLAVLIALVAYLVARFFFGFFHIADPTTLHEAVVAFQILGFFLISRFVLNGFTQTLVGLQRTDVFNVLDIFEEIARIGGLVFCLTNGYGLPWLAAAVLGVSLLRQAGILIWLRLSHPEIEFRFDAIDRQRGRELFSFSRIAFGITLGWLVVFGTDSILLGLLATPLAAGIYAPATQLMLYLRHMVNAIGSPFTPAVSQLEAQADIPTVAQAYLKGITYVSYLSFFAAAGVLCYAQPFVHLWLPESFRETAPVMMILSVGSAFFLPQILGNSVLFGLSRHRYLLIILAIESALKLALSFLLIGPYGAVGMAIATTIPQVLLYSAIYPVIVARQIGLKASTLIVGMARRAALALLMTFPLASILKLANPPVSWPRLAVDIIAVTIVVALAGYRFVLAPEDKVRVIRFLSRSGTAR